MTQRARKIPHRIKCYFCEKSQTSTDADVEKGLNIGISNIGKTPASVHLYSRRILGNKVSALYTQMQTLPT